MQGPEALLARILARVEKPGRYIGGEWNQVVKPWDQVAARVALVFPEVYEIGMSNLGLAILYDVLNREPDILAERVYAPWVDMERELRAARLPLFSLESRRPLHAFDVVGISLPYEQLYTNALNVLDLGGIPLLAAERGGEDPIVIAGGGATYNPEPMADFIDAFVIGEGEEVAVEVVREVARWLPERRAPGARKALLRRLAAIPGVYVPSLYRVSYHADGTVRAVEPAEPGVPARVRKRVVPRLPPPPTRLVVPHVDIVHNRAMVEIQRGCTRGCRFCHAGFTYRPVRERPLEEILWAVEEVLAHTGYDELALLSLSTSDYSRIQELVGALRARYAGEHLSISLPSLRLDSFSVDLVDSLQGGRRTGLTFAPEAATPGLRQAINKPIPEEDLLEVARLVYRRGWPVIKLYFMIGLPGETVEDVEAIAHLVKKVLAIGREEMGGRARVHVGVSTFVPKPHTPFQWAPLAAEEDIRGKQDLLRRMLRKGPVRLTWNDPHETWLEAILSRGDRRLGPVILEAWRAGARFDGWQEQFQVERWQEAFARAGLDPTFYLRARPFEELLPWEHIDAGVSRRFLWREYQRGLVGEVTPDCRAGCVGCGVNAAFRELEPVAAWACPPLGSRGNPADVQPAPGRREEA
ncbi:MAG: TIGR03960 family B12-binding radical SAM protein [Anaerolineae bacterium]